uniref:Uncharacterized protein n=1 Tax=Janibacter limosus TaxID=53458 RepID=A0AC61U109_9MICO|nr:hypothetical protein [Janibacter limosus]
MGDAGPTESRHPAARGQIAGQDHGRGKGRRQDGLVPGVQSQTAQVLADVVGAPRRVVGRVDDRDRQRVERSSGVIDRACPGVDHAVRVADQPVVPCGQPVAGHDSLVS